MPVSPEPKPAPLTVSELPAAPLLWLSVMLPPTMKVTSGTLAPCVEGP